MTNASAELFAAPSMLVAGSFDVETTSHALSPDDASLSWEVFWGYDSPSFDAAA